jgi:hypothetical protein
MSQAERKSAPPNTSVDVDSSERSSKHRSTATTTTAAPAPAASTGRGGSQRQEDEEKSTMTRFQGAQRTCVTCQTSHIHTHLRRMLGPRRHGTVFACSQVLCKTSLYVPMVRLCGAAARFRTFGLLDTVKSAAGLVLNSSADGRSR